MSQAPRIAVDARPLAFPDSGIGRYTGSLLREFARQKNPPDLFLYCDRPTTPAFALPAHWILRCGNIRQRALSTPFAQVMFPIWARKDRIDTFWSPRHHLPLLLPRRIRKLLTIHDVVWKRHPDTMTRGGRLIESLLMPASLGIADRVIAVSQFTRQEIMELFRVPPDKIDVIYEASSLHNDGSALPSMIEAPYFLFVGSSEPRKNLVRLLNAYLQYRDSATTPVHLVLAGSYEWGSFNVPEFIGQHGLQQQVHLLRTVSDATLSGLYANATALVMPSLYEGFGLPLVEAMQWGIPLITAGSSAMAEIAGDAALLIDPRDRDAIRLALHQIANDATLHQTLARHSKARGRQFRWAHAAIETRRLLEAKEN